MGVTYKQMLEDAIFEWNKRANRPKLTLHSRMFFVNILDIEWITEVITDECEVIFRQTRRGMPPPEMSVFEEENCGLIYKDLTNAGISHMIKIYDDLLAKQRTRY